MVGRTACTNSLAPDNDASIQDLGFKRKYNINIEIKIVGNKVIFPFICIIKEIQRRMIIKNKT
jgi:hypothetical protein